MAGTPSSGLQVGHSAVIGLTAQVVRRERERENEECERRRGRRVTWESKRVRE